MIEKTLEAIVKKFLNQNIVFGNFMLNRILRDHPELADSKEVQELKALLQDLIEQEKHL
jgi:hypothetical protein